MIFDRVESDEERLKNVLISDKQFSPERLKKVMRSDVYSMLSNYCEITPKDFDINVGRCSFVEKHNGAVAKECTGNAYALCLTF